MDTAGHGGDIYGQKVQDDFSVNLSLLGTPPAVQRAVRRAALLSDRYPDVWCRSLRRELARHLDVPEEHLLFGNGAAELFFLYAHAIGPQKALLFTPCFLEYARSLQAAGAQICTFPTEQADGFVPGETAVSFLEDRADGIETIYLCTPANPSGRCIALSVLARLLTICKEKNIRVVLDLCFLEFADVSYRRAVLSMAADNPLVLAVMAFTKTYAMAGLRLGYAVCADTELLQKMEAQGQPWRVSVPAQEAGLAALRCKRYAGKLANETRRQRAALQKALEAMGLTVIPSDANFLLFQGPKGLQERLLKKGILIRGCADYEGLDDTWYRVAVKDRRANGRLIRAMETVPGLLRASRDRKQRGADHSRKGKRRWQRS